VRFFWPKYCECTLFRVNVSLQGTSEIIDCNAGTNSFIYKFNFVFSEIFIETPWMTSILYPCTFRYLWQAVQVLWII
jgi:hypothetical protein